VARVPAPLAAERASQLIRPCEPAPVVRPPGGPGWLHEVKHDGFRILALKQGERLTLWSRCGADCTDRFLDRLGGSRPQGDDLRLHPLEKSAKRSHASSRAPMGFCSAKRWRPRRRLRPRLQTGDVPQHC
jgi:hypothetical protein